jgi:NAD+---dinitrogen-reductase ADP-D-ribosyltransferase
VDRSWTLSWNLCDLPAWYIGSLAFNERPQRFELQTVAHSAADLFRHLDTFPDAHERTGAFNAYLAAKFHLDELERDHTRNAKRSLRNTYVRYLRGWGVDSNSIEGAVLKAWVESRIGLRPTFHRGKVPSETDEGQLAFAIDRMKGMAGSNAINSQLDLVYAYCQYELQKVYPGQTWLDLFRGTHDPDDYQTLEVLSPRERIVRLNNLSSFTPDAERAFEFGSTVWGIRVPLVKVFFYSQLFPQSLLKGEDEFLVIGGIYRVKTVL